MNEFLNSIFPAWVTEHVYVPYLFALILIVEWVRYQIDGIDQRIKPKHLVAIIGVVLAFACYYFEKIEGVELTFKVMVISYFFSTFFYEYVLKPLKEKFFPGLADKQKH